jgi:zinc protease
MKSIIKYCGCLAVSIALLLPLVSCAQSKTERVVVLKKPGLPVVYFRVMISAGSAMDPTAKPGLAYFTANLLNKGTTSYTRDQLEDKLSQIGAQIGISVDKEVVVITGKTLAEKVGEFYSIFREVLTAPTFAEDQVKKMQSEQLDRINNIREDDSRLALGVFENKLFEGHRYGHLVEGTEEAVKRFTRDDAYRFYRDNYLQGNVLAGIGGAVEDTLLERFEADLGKMPSGQVVRSAAEPKVEKTRRVILVEKENRAQMQLRVGHVVDYNRTNPDYFPMRLLSAYLGENREAFGRLYQTVREQRGLAYGAYAYGEHFRPAGWSKLIDNGIVRSDEYFHMMTYPKEANGKFCIKLMLSEMTKLTTTPVSQDDFDRAQSYVANQYAFLMETPDKQLGMRLDELWYKTPGFVDNYQENLNKVPHSEMQSVALDHLHPDHVLIVAVVSNGEATKKQLLGADTKLELPSGAQEGALKEINDQIKAFDLNLKPEDIVIVKAREMFK